MTKTVALPVKRSPIGINMSDGAATKVCTKCGVEKGVEKFYQRVLSKDGLQSWCKACGMKERRIWRATHRERVNASARKHWATHTIASISRCKHWRDANPERARAAKNTWALQHPGATHAHDILNNALRAGRILKPSVCFSCGGNVRLCGHHENYSKPLDVVWLCQSCHELLHNAQLEKEEVVCRRR